jgi:hypothetical protein
MFVVDEAFASIPMALDWDTFDEGAVRKAMKSLPSGTLPGSEAAAEVLEYALNEVPNLLPLNPPETFYGVQHDTPVGLPVNLSKRKIVVERYHALTEPIDETTCEEIAEALQRTLSAACPSLIAASVMFGPFSTDFYPMIRLALSWHPPLDQSSADAFLEIEPKLLEEFDRLLPRRPFQGAGPHGTIDVLTYVGNIHFNPDYWDHFKASS